MTLKGRTTKFYEQSEGRRSASGNLVWPLCHFRQKGNSTIYFLGVVSFIIEEVKNVVRVLNQVQDSLVQDGKGKRARP